MVRLTAPFSNQSQLHRVEVLRFIGNDHARLVWRKLRVMESYVDQVREVQKTIGGFVLTPSRREIANGIGQFSGTSIFPRQ